MLQMASGGPPEYLQMLGRSNLVPRERLARLVAEFKRATEDHPERRTVGTLSKLLIDAGAITPWQDAKLREAASSWATTSC